MPLDAVHCWHLIHNHEQFKQDKQNLYDFGVWVGLPLLIFLKGIVLVDMLIKPTLLAIVYTALISRAAAGLSGIPGRILELKPLVFLGKISYRLYLYHLFMNPVFSKTYELKLLAPIPLSLEFVLKSLLTRAIAIPSWFLIEKPIKDLKRNFSYKKAQ